MKQLPHFQNDEEARVWFDTHDTADFMASMEHIILADEDWLNDSEEEMQAEDALWAESMARHPEHFAALSAAARAEIAAHCDRIGTRNQSHGISVLSQLLQEDHLI